MSLPLQTKSVIISGCKGSQQERYKKCCAWPVSYNKNMLPGVDPENSERGGQFSHSPPLPLNKNFTFQDMQQ